jgi:F-type H+-transporting ATPase subunit b
MPQINQLMLAYASQWFWLLLVLGTIYFVIGRGMVPKIEATVDARDRKIADDLAAAHKARAEADDTEVSLQSKSVAARAEAQSIAVAAKAKAAQDAANRLAKADSEIGEKLAIAEKTLNKAREAALSSVQTIAAEAAQDIVAKVSGASVTAANATKAVKAVLANG